MRFILQADVYEYLPPNWDDLVREAKTYVEDKAARARAEAEAAGEDPEGVKRVVLQAIHKAINAKSDVWRTAAPALRLASYEKCWYCESKQDRSDKPVDHFRPKNGVIEAPGHPGYWWLAFDWRNFRYSCTYCNSKRCDLDGSTEGGKQDHFPIIPPPPHACRESDPQDRAKLLDPTNDNDTKLLTFLPNGFPHPASNDKEAVDRVAESIRLFHLDHSAIVRRRKVLAFEIQDHVHRGDDARADARVSDYLFHKTEIIRRVRARAEFSTAARIYLHAYRAYPWVEEILNRDL